MTNLIIAVDFDGTIVEHRFPDIGKPVPGALETMKECIDLGARIVLWTMRSDTEREPYLTHAVEYLVANGIRLFGVNQNPETDWTTSPKAYAHIYVDDSALGCPLIPSTTGRPMVDWSKVHPVLIAKIRGHR